MAEHAAMENMVDDEAVEAEVDDMRVINTIITFIHHHQAEVEDMRRKRREAEPVVIPTHANVLPATTYHHLAGAYPVYYNNPYLTYPLHQVQSKSQKQKDLEIMLSDTKGLHSVGPLGDLIYI